YVERSVSGLADFQSPIWDYGIIAKQSITLNGTASISSAPAVGIGNVHSNGDMTIGSNLVVKGKATAVGTLTSSGVGTGGTQSHASEVPFPTVDTARLRSEAEAKGITTGDVHFTSGTHVLGGKIVGDLTISALASITIDGILWVTGNVRLEGQSYGGDG